ncbi:chloroplast protein [Tanacetum coccineum]
MVSRLGEPPVDGITHANPEGLATTFGKWGSVVAARLQSSGLSCKYICALQGKSERKSLPQGVFPFGPPGTGKTTLVHVMAHEAKVSFSPFLLGMLQQELLGSKDKPKDGHHPSYTLKI